MSGITATFLVIGGIGVLILALAVLGAELLHFGHWDVADGPWSVEAIAGFAGAFGFAGAIASEVAGTGPAVVIGALAAVPTAWLALRLSRAARNMRTDATPTRADLVGSLGVVVTAIPAQGYGEVRVRLGGQPVKLNARADGPIPMGAEIFVVDAPSDTSVIVEPTMPPTS